LEVFFSGLSGFAALIVLLDTLQLFYIHSFLCSSRCTLWVNRFLPPP
jgi:hypothetical protein